MGIEIEKKFLVKDESFKIGAEFEEIRQAYLSTDPGRTVRVRIYGDDGFTPAVAMPAWFKALISTSRDRYLAWRKDFSRTALLRLYSSAFSSRVCSRALWADLIRGAVRSSNHEISSSATKCQVGRSKCTRRIFPELIAASISLSVDELRREPKAHFAMGKSCACIAPIQRISWFGVVRV